MASYPPEALFQAAKRYKKQIFYKDLKANRISQLKKLLNESSMPKNNI